MLAECEVILQKLQTLKSVHRNAWMTYNKPFGWEVHDIRYGGMIARFETAQLRLGAYLAGTLDRIEELEEERLRADGMPEDAEPFGGYFNWHRYASNATAGVLN